MESNTELEHEVAHLETFVDETCAEANPFKTLKDDYDSLILVGRFLVLNSHHIHIINYTLRKCIDIFVMKHNVITYVIRELKND